MKIRTFSSASASARNAYTLLELVMSMVVLSIIGLVSSNVIMESMKIYAQTVPSLDAAYKSNLAMHTMQRDIRRLKETASITAFTSTSFTFQDLDGTTIAYLLTGTDLTRNGDLLAEDVTSFTFNYFEEGGTAAASANVLHFIEIDLTVQSGEQVFHTRNYVFPRVLGLGV